MTTEPRPILEYRVSYTTRTGNKSRVYQTKSGAFAKARSLREAGIEPLIQARYVPSVWANCPRDARQVADDTFKWSLRRG